MRVAVWCVLIGSLLAAKPLVDGLWAPTPQPFSEAGLEALASLTEDEVDLGEAALFLASEVFTDIDVRHYSAQLDRMVREIRQLTQGSSDPDDRIRALNTYLYKWQGFRYDFNDPYGQQLKNRYLHGLLETKTGSCTTMPLLYLVLAQRLGYPIYPVAAPQHLFGRYVTSDFKQNIEATSGGGYSPDEAYRRDLEIPEPGITSGAYLRTMTYRELLGDLIAENSSYWARQNEFIRAVKYYELALTLSPKSAEVHRMLAHAYRKLAREYLNMDQGLPTVVRIPTLEATRRLYRSYSREYQEASDQAMEQATALGVAPLLEANYWVRQRELAQVAHQDSPQIGDIQ